MATKVRASNLHTDVTTLIQSLGGGEGQTITAITANTTLSNSDKGKLIQTETSGITITIPALSSLDADWFVDIETLNTNTFNHGKITLDITTNNSGASINRGGNETMYGASKIRLQRSPAGGDSQGQLSAFASNYLTGGIIVREDRLAGGLQGGDVGVGSIMLGNAQDASGNDAIAIGQLGSATGTGSVAIGSYNGSSATTVAAATGAVAIGSGRAGGTRSLALQIQNSSTSYGASGGNSVAIGYQAKATTDPSMALGHQANATGTGSQAFGYMASATGHYSTAIGLGASASQSDEIAIGGTGKPVKIANRYTLPTADGTNGQVMTTDGSGAVTFADAAGGVTGFTSADNTSSPNNTVNVASFTAASSSTNAGIAIVPKGTGSFSLAIPDGTTAGGDARGSYAIDLSLGRTNANRVASASKSVGIGYNAKANGQGGVAIAGAGNICQGSYGVALGYDSNVYGSYSTVINAGGSGTDGGSSYALALGNGSKAGAEGSGAVIRGYTETKNTFAIGTKDKLYTQRVTGNLYGITPNATPATISTKGLNQTVSKANFPTIAAGDSSSGMYAATIKGTLHAIDDTNNEIRVWEFCRSFKMHDNVKSAVGNTVKNLLVSDGTTMANTDFSIELSSGTRTIIFTVTGVASTNIRWNAHYTIYQTKYE